MRKLLFSAVLALSGVAFGETFAELDTSVKNDFWDCTVHVNPTIVRAAPGSATPIDTVMCASDDSDYLNPFEARYATFWMTPIMMIDARPLRGILLYLR